MVVGQHGHKLWPADYERYPEHDHAEDGQEEVFMALRGAGELEIAGERFNVSKLGEPDPMAS